MRADRLIAILMLLQTRGKVTTAEVAGELEISERTARRDLDALGAAGLPIVSYQGRGGGWQLLGDGTTDLSGLTANETLALFVMAGPESATPEVRAALRKLTRALPEPLRERAHVAQTSFVTDDVPWGGRSDGAAEPPLLDVVQRAVVDAQQLTIDYADRLGAVSSRVIEPWGIATKSGHWYLVAGTAADQRSFRVDRMRAVAATGAPATRPDGFVMADVWADITDRYSSSHLFLWATGDVAIHLLSPLRRRFQDRVRIGAALADDPGRVQVELGAVHPMIIAETVAGFGRGVRITSPPEVVEALTGLARELAALYAPTP